MSATASVETVESVDDRVHVDQAAKALGVSRRTVERMIERGELQRDTRHDSRVAGAYVTKRSLVAAKARRDTATRQSRDVSQPNVDALAAVLEQLAGLLESERRQLMAASEDRRRAELEAARLEAELRAERERRAAAEARVAELETRRRRRWFRRAA